MIFSSDGQWMYTLDAGQVGDGHVVIIDTKTHKINRLICRDRSIDPFNLALSKDGRLLYVSNSGSDDITVIDTQTETVADRIPIQIEED